IPVLNEAGLINHVVSWHRELFPQAEIIIVDGGSSDDTVKIAREAGTVLIETEWGRGTQCNAGVKSACGDIFLFLHCDTYLSADAPKVLKEYFANEKVQIGTFQLGFDHHQRLLRFYSFFTRFDSILTRFGDQCIVVRKSFFNTLGGFPDWPLFEDVHFLRMARRQTKIVSLPATAVTSARRFQRKGIIRTQLLNGWLIIRYLLGASPTDLAKQYLNMKDKVPPNNRSASFHQETKQLSRAKHVVTEQQAKT
ncbi:MAG: TIGR04283 family arsenosugar biosynthesis glycosyltransferase, partial [Calditrichia bacterium]